jgi:flagellar FliL protein
MADETMDEAPVEAPAPSGKTKRLILFGGVAVLLLVGIAAGLYFSGIAQAILGMGKTAKKSDSAATTVSDNIFYDMPDILVNLNVAGRHENYLKLDISLQIENADDKKKIDDALPRVMDTCQTYLRELRLEDLRGSAGLYRLREELQMRIGIAVAPVKIDDVLFKQLLVQ